MFHLDWPFLDPQSITIIYVAAPVMSCYGNLRAEASYLTAKDIHRICTSLDHRTFTYSIYPLHTHDVDNILLLCDFPPGGMICCLGGVYTI